MAGFSAKEGDNAINLLLIAIKNNIVSNNKLTVSINLPETEGAIWKVRQAEIVPHTPWKRG